MPDHDGDYKVIFSYPETVEALLRGFVHERWVERLDFSTLERVNASHVSEHLRRIPPSSPSFRPPRHPSALASRTICSRHSLSVSSIMGWRAISSAAALQRLARRALTAESLAALRLEPGPAR